uniref:Retrovirus-related Pol polyprotein from transposon TNT 1-94 n=1 Tax=Nicotiana tabacum TaxID=4097 RepID=A0A1S4AG67_TOBAC|nr:PREDICTED: uncharacterized protein LOC107797080 [Nicotiana tabacum]
MHPTPSLDQAYSMIIQKESQRKNNDLVIHGGILRSAPVDIDHTALASANAFNVKPKRNAGLYCDYCKMKGHTREGCYKLIGYPSGFKCNNRKIGSYEQSSAVAHNVTIGEEVNAGVHRNVVPTIHPFTAEQYQQILKLLNKEKGSDASANMAGNFTTNQRPWIIDTGASNHIISALHLLSSVYHVPELKSPTVHLPNENSTKVTHTGSCTLPNSEILYDVLYVPEFQFNLFSVSRYTKELNSSVHFYPDFCVFRDLFSGMVKGIGYLCYATKPDFHDKFTPKSVPGVFMGYATTQKRYRIYDIEANKFIVCRDIVFHENLYLFKHPTSKFLATYDPSSTSSPFFPNSAPLPSHTPDHQSISNDIIPLPNDPAQSSNSPICSPDPINSLPSTVSPDPSDPPLIPPIDPPTDSLLPRRSGRTLKLSIWLTDYIHHLLPSASTVCLYLIHHFASYSHLPAHFQSFLASFSANIESTSYSQAIKDDR